MGEKEQAYRKALGKEKALYRVSDKLRNIPDGTDGCKKSAALYVMAPVLCMYVEWVLREACAAGIKRLYFLARDGYSMYETARIFCAEKGLPIECRYLYCSRYAWRRAEYHLLGEGSLSYICLGGIDVHFGKLMSRAGLDEEEGRKVAGLVGMAGTYEKPLTYGKLKEVRKLLAGCGPFLDAVAEKSRCAYPAVTGYLKQEGLLDGVPWALVDSGWTGSMQKSLQHLLDTMGYQGKTEGYYFGMYEYPEGVNPETYHSWYFGPWNGLVRKAYFSNSLFECIFSSPEGMTAGYEKRGGRYCPVLEKSRNPNRERIEITTRYLKQYAEELWKSSGKEFLTDSLTGRVQDNKRKRLAFCLLKSFMGRPSREEAEEFGSYIFCDDVIGEGNQRAAAELTPEEIRGNWLVRRAVSCGKREGRRIRESAWLEGSMVRAGLGREGLWHCMLCRYAVYLRKLWKNCFKYIR